LWWLISATTAVAFISLGIFVHSRILDGLYKKQHLYQTAIRTTDKEQFNYSIDSKQGNILTYGTFHFVDFVKFPEMKKSFSMVEKTKERYTRHEHEECDTDEEGNETNCHTVVEYTWDYAGRERLEGKKVKFFDREYNTSQFAFGSIRDIDAGEIVDGSVGHYWYPEGDKGYKFFGFGGNNVGDIRYKYSVRDETVTGSIFINTYSGFQSAENGIIRVDKASIEERVKNVTIEAKWASGGFIVLWTLLTIAATVGVTYLWFSKVHGS
jgi:hypothetical protein